MDRRWSRKIQPRLFWSVKIHDQIVTTWWYSSSRRWWCCEIWPGRKFQGKVWWSIEPWITFLAKRGGPKKRCQYCVNPNASKHFLYFKAIQGHSGGTLVDPTLREGVLLPDDFAENINHFGNAHDMHSIIQGGLIWTSVFTPWTRRTPIKIKKKLNTIWTNPEWRCSTILGEFTKVHNIDALWNSLKAMECSSLKPDR